MDSTPEQYITDVIECIKSARAELAADKDSTHQTVGDIRAGLFRKHKQGIVVPLSGEIHRIQLEGHELAVIDGYLLLAEKLLSDPSERLAYFSLRVLLEVGFDKINALFAAEVSEEDRTEFKVADCLSDCLGIQGKEYGDWFVALYREERNNLSPEFQVLFDEAEKVLSSGGKIGLPLLKRVRRLLSRKLGQYIQNVPVPDPIKGKSDLEPLQITFSHLLHGNPILLRVALHPTFEVGNANHVMLMLWNTALNVLIQLRPSMKDEALKQRSDDLIAKAESVLPELNRRRVQYRNSRPLT